MERGQKDKEKKARMKEDGGGLRRIRAIGFPLWILTGIFEVGERWFTGVIVQEALDRTDRLWRYLCVLSVLVLVSYLLANFSSYFMNRIIEPAVMGIRERLLCKMMHTEYGNVEKLNRGEILTKLTQNLGTVQTYEEQLLPEIVRGATKGLLALAVCIRISPLLSLILLLSIPLIILINAFTSVPARSLVEKRNTLENRQNSYAQNRLENIGSVKVYALEKSSAEEYGEILGRQHGQNVKIANLKAFLTLLDGLNYILPYVLIFGGATLLAVNGKMKVGGIVSFTYLMDYITSLLGNLQRYIFETAEKKDADKRIRQILQMNDIPRKTQEESADGDGEISFRNVTFTYEEKGDPALQDVSLRIRRGEKVAVIGESGSGKSTLLKLISGLYSVTQGSLHIGSAKIAYVSQENFLLEASVADNIRGQNASLDDSSVREAARKAGIDGFAEGLPRQYETVVSRAGKLSGGEVQRICLARAYAQDAEILLLDEPASALDHENERLVWDQVKKEKGKTIIMITHMLLDETVFDKIYCVENGRVREAGGTCRSPVIGNGGKGI